MTRYMLYSKATAGGGAIVKSTSSGGGTVKSTSSGGATTRTTSSGGGTSRSTQSGGGGTRTSTVKLFGNIIQLTGAPLEGDYSKHQHMVDFPNGTFDHSHSVTIPAHSHEFTVPNHTHEVSIPNHTHEIEIPSHSHEIQLPDHTHNVKHEIVELDTMPSSVVIKVDGNTVPHTSTSGDRINLIPYMAKDSDGKITRGRHEVEILPNGLARIEADVILRVFIQSQLGGTY